MAVTKQDLADSGAVSLDGDDATDVCVLVKQSGTETSRIQADGQAEFSSIVGSDASLAITGDAPATVTSAGGAVAIAGGIGGATSGAGGAVTANGGAATASNSAGGASNRTGGAGSGSSAGGACLTVGGAGGATGAGGAVTATGGAGGATSGTGGAAGIAGGVGTAGNSAGGAATVVGGAGQGTATGGVASLTAGASGAGATGNGAAASVVGGAALSTNGNGGDVVLTPGALTGTGAKGIVRIGGTAPMPFALSVVRTTIANAATLTDVETAGQVLYQDASGGNVTMTTRTGTQYAAYFAGMGTGSAIKLHVASNHATNTSTIAGGTDVTLVGSGAVTQTGGQFLLIKTAATTFDLVRVG